jgi:glycerol-3-phosphate cytidylyltransferase
MRGDRLIVGVSTDEFNAIKGKQSVVQFSDRAEIVGALRCVDRVFPEVSWSQKRDDIINYGVKIFGMGDDWRGKFDDYTNLCEVIYLPRTPEVSSSNLMLKIRSEI